MGSLAAVILAHTDPPHLRRLIASLTDIPIFLHIDAKTSRLVGREMLTGLPERVTVVEPIATSLGSWSLVEAELRALRRAQQTGADHIIVASGADYPLISMEALFNALSPWEGLSHFWNTPIPYPAWDTPRARDGGLWRFKHRFLTREGQVLHWRNVPVRIPVRRALPKDLELRAASQWKIYARHHAEALLRVVDSRPDLVKFGQTTYIPDESFAASILSSPALVGQDYLRPCRARAWFIRWDDSGGSTHHPFWLDTHDAEELVQAARSRPMTPEESLLPYTVRMKHQKWFARKFSSGKSAVLDYIDRNKP